MAGLCGWFGIGGAETPGHLEIQGSALPAMPGAAQQQREGPVGGCLVRGGWVSEDPQGRIAAITGHPRWRQTELARLAREHDPAHALLEAWRRSGDDLFSALAGDFALAVLDPQQGRMLAGIDRIGQVPLHFARTADGVVFGTTAGSVAARPGVAATPVPQGLYHYLFFHMIPAPMSVFAGMEKLPGAHRLSHAGGVSRAEPYWIPRFEEPAGADQRALAGELREHLGEAVARQIDTPRPGAFLSGGLDSSTVAGMLSLSGAGPAETFSIGFDAPGYDEMEYARIAAGHFDTRRHEFYVTPDDVVEAVPLIAASYDEPFGNSSALPAWFCARMAADAGISRMLAGDGGDELFAGNARYAKQGVFEHWNRLPAGLRQRLLEPLFTRLPQRIPPLRKARSYVEQARLPLPERLESYNYLHRLPLAGMFEPEFLAQIDPDAPWALMRRTWGRPEGASTLSRMLYLDWQQTLADNDLRKVTRMCQLAGVDVVFPMLDDDLVEFSCRVPSAAKLRRGRLRHFYKEAMDGFLPAAIIDKKKHGFGLPFGLWMHEHAPLREMAYDSLLRFKRRGILQPAFIDRLIHLHREGHAAYYGELVWVLMMLDLWLAAHEG